MGLSMFFPSEFRFNVTEARTFAFQQVALQCNPFQKTLMEGSVEEGIDLGSACKLAALCVTAVFGIIIVILWLSLS